MSQTTLKHLTPGTLHSSVRTPPCSQTSCVHCQRECRVGRTSERRAHAHQRRAVAVAAASSAACRAAAALTVNRPSSGAGWASTKGMGRPGHGGRAPCSCLQQPFAGLGRLTGDNEGPQAVFVMQRHESQRRTACCCVHRRGSALQWRLCDCMHCQCGHMPEHWPASGQVVLQTGRELHVQAVQRRAPLPSLRRCLW